MSKWRYTIQLDTDVEAKTLEQATSLLRGRFAYPDKITELSGSTYEIIEVRRIVEKVDKEKKEAIPPVPDPEQK